MKVYLLIPKVSKWVSIQYNNYILHRNFFLGKEKNLSKSEPTNGFLIAFPSLRSFPQNRRRWKYHIQCVPYPSTYNVGPTVCSPGYLRTQARKYSSWQVDQAAAAYSSRTMVIEKGHFPYRLKGAGLYWKYSLTD